MSTADFRVAVERGDDPSIKSDAVQANYGMRVAGDLVPKMDEAVAGLDKESGDFDGTLRPMVSEAMRGLSPVAAEAFAKTVEPYLQRGAKGWASAKIETAQAGQADGASAQYQAIIAKMTDAGRSPAEIASAVWGSHKANVKLLGLDHRAAEGIVYGIAKAAAAEGKPGLFDALVDDPRGGVGAISGKAGLTMEIAKLREAARDKAVSDASDRNFEPFANIIAKAHLGELGKSDLDEFETKFPELLKGGRKASLLAQSSAAKTALAERKAKEEAKAQAQRDALSAEDGYVTNALAAARLGRFNEVPEMEVPNGTPGGTKTLKPQDAADLLVQRFRKRLDDPSVSEPSGSEPSMSARTRPRSARSRPPAA